MLIENVKCHSFAVKLNTEDMQVWNKNEPMSALLLHARPLADRGRSVETKGPERKTSTQP